MHHRTNVGVDRHGTEATLALLDHELLQRDFRRLALGARPWPVGWSIVRESSGQVLAGVALGLAAYYLLPSLLSSLLFRTLFIKCHSRSKRFMFRPSVDTLPADDVPPRGSFDGTDPLEPPSPTECD